MTDQIQSIVASLADALGVEPDELIGQTVRNILSGFDNFMGGYVVLWGLYDEATLDTVVTWEHMSETTRQSYLRWFLSHGAAGQA